MQNILPALIHSRLMSTTDNQMGTNPTAFYDNFAKRQLNTGINNRHIAIFKGLKSAGIKPGANILEIGCGVGTFTQMLASKSKAGTITALDLSGVNIGHAQERLAKYSNIRFLTEDVINANIEGKFDIIVLPDVIEHIPIEQHSILFQKLSRLLLNDGYIFINIPQPFLQEWHRKYQPELMQIIDQSVHTLGIVECLEQSGLYLFSLNTYVVWVKECDYQQLIVKHKPEIHKDTFHQIPQHSSVWNRIKQSLAYRLKKH